MKFSVKRFLIATMFGFLAWLAFSGIGFFFSTSPEEVLQRAVERERLVCSGVSESGEQGVSDEEDCIKKP
ncbi:MAG: hypothetical protein F6J87_25640 [Spirulina sp. SIO3F2]|nr:hypothetical protein [Spirulina sp. SIO3F2]